MVRIKDCSELEALPIPYIHWYEEEIGTPALREISIGVYQLERNAYEKAWQVFYGEWSCPLMNGVNVQFYFVPGLNRLGFKLSVDRKVADPKCEKVLSTFEGLLLKVEVMPEFAEQYHNLAKFDRSLIPEPDPVENLDHLTESEKMYRILEILSKIK